MLRTSEASESGWGARGEGIQKMLLFSPSVLVAGGVAIGMIALDKTLSSFGFYWLGDILRILLPVAALALGVYFLEYNPLTTGLFK